MATSSSDEEKKPDSNKLDSLFLTTNSAASSHSTDWEIVNPTNSNSPTATTTTTTTSSNSSSVEVLQVSEADDTDDNADVDIGVELTEEEPPGHAVSSSSMQASTSTVTMAPAAASPDLVVIDNDVINNEENGAVDAVEAAEPEQQQQPLFTGQSEQRLLKAIRLLQNSLPQQQPQPPPPSPPPLRLEPPTPPPEPEPARLRIIRRWLAYDDEDNLADRESPPESDLSLADSGAPPAPLLAPAANAADYDNVLPDMLVETSRSRHRQYLHRPNDPVNGRLTVLCLVALAFAFGLGFGHFVGLSSGRDGQLLIGCRAWRADQAARSRALRRDLLACTRRYDDLELAVSELKSTLVQKEYVDKWESLYAESEEEKEALRVAKELYKTRYNREKAKNEELSERLAEAERACNMTQSVLQINQLKTENSKLQDEVSQLRASQPTTNSKWLCGKLDRILSNDSYWLSALSNGTATAVRVGSELLRDVNNVSSRLLGRFSNSSGGVMMKKFSNATVKLFRRQFDSVKDQFLRKLPKRYAGNSDSVPATLQPSDEEDKKLDLNHTIIIDSNPSVAKPESPVLLVAKDGHCVIGNKKQNNKIDDFNSGNAQAGAKLRWSFDGRAAARERQRKLDAKSMRRLRKLRRGQKKNSIKSRRGDWYDQRLKTRENLRKSGKSSNKDSTNEANHDKDYGYDDDIIDRRLTINERAADVKWGVDRLKAAISKVTTRLARLKEKFEASKMRRKCD